MASEDSVLNKRKLSGGIGLPIRSRKSQNTATTAYSDDDLCKTCGYGLNIYTKPASSCGSCGQDPRTCEDFLAIMRRLADMTQKFRQKEKDFNDLQEEHQEVLATNESTMRGHGYERQPYRPKFKAGGLLSDADMRIDNQGLCFDVELHLNDQPIDRETKIKVVGNYEKLRKKFEFLFSRTLRKEGITKEHFVGFSVENSDDDTRDVYSFVRDAVVYHLWFRFTVMNAASPRVHRVRAVYEKPED